MTRQEWEDWFERLDPTFPINLTNDAETALERVSANLGYLEPYVGTKADEYLEQIKEHTDKAEEGFAQAFEKAEELLGLAVDEAHTMQRLAARYLAEHQAFALPKPVSLEAMRWCAEHLTDYLFEQYTDGRAFVVVFKDTERVLFKLRWNDAILDGEEAA